MILVIACVIFRNFQQQMNRSIDSNTPVTGIYTRAQKWLDNR